MSLRHQMPKHELNNLGSTQSVNEIWPVYVTLQKQKVLLKNSTKNVAWKLVPGLF